MVVPPPQSITAFFEGSQLESAVVGVVAGTVGLVTGSEGFVAGRVGSVTGSVGFVVFSVVGFVVFSVVGFVVSSVVGSDTDEVSFAVVSASETLSPAAIRKMYTASHESILPSPFKSALLISSFERLKSPHHIS